MTGKEHWQRSMNIYLRVEKRKRDPAELREEMNENTKELTSYLSERSEERNEYAKRFQEDVQKIRDRLNPTFRTLHL